MRGKEGIWGVADTSCCSRRVGACVDVRFHTTQSQVVVSPWMTRLLIVSLKSVNGILRKHIVCLERKVYVTVNQKQHRLTPKHRDPQTLSPSVSHRSILSPHTDTPTDTGTYVQIYSTIHTHTLMYTPTSTHTHTRDTSCPFGQTAPTNLTNIVAKVFASIRAKHCK